MQDAQREPLALVGIGCRLPGGIRNVDQLWQMLVAGQSAISEVPADRWNLDRYYHADSSIEGRIISRRGGFVHRPRVFDPAFWGISPREAKRMDPQQRWLLETAWEALEDAGIVAEQLRGSNTGVFVGISSHDYGSIQLDNPREIDVHTNSGGTLSISANRVSYLFDFKGPSVAVDTACSSALVAFSMACKAVWSGECCLALAGGVNALFLPNTSIGFSKAGMLSPRGECSAFDADADGYVRGEGAGMVAVKPLAAALANGDPIYCVVRSAVVNQDGNTSSMTVPGVDGQSAMLRAAYEEAGVEPRQVTYVEAHGTGTPVGDPIEATALGNVLSQGREVDSSCLMGSVKTNIGHLEPASGIAGLIKAALIARHDTVVPSLNFETPNPNICFEHLQLKVATEVQPLPHVGDEPAVVAVNSFGFGGTNAHVVLQSPPVLVNDPLPVSPSAQRPFLLPISARCEGSLRGQVKNLNKFLLQQEDDSTSELANICYSSGERREHHPHRLVVIGSDAGELRQNLSQWLKQSGDDSQVQSNAEPFDRVFTGRASTTPASHAFVFTGQGPQWWGMGRQILDREPVFRQTIEQVDQALRPFVGWSLLEELTKDEEASRIQQTDVAQPALFALQVGLAELWRSWGIQPDVVVGHSVGEVAAAYCAGILNLNDAARLVYHRSRLQHSTAGEGRMLVAGISAANAREKMADHGGRVQLAAINSRDLVTLSGDREPLEIIGAQLEREGKFIKWLGVNYAFHSHQMDSIREELLTSLAEIQPRSGHTRFVSTVTGELHPGEMLDADYWWQNVRRPVLFATAIATIANTGPHHFVEIGPHPSLRSSITATLAGLGVDSQPFHSLQRNRDESAVLTKNLAGLHIAGAKVDWASINQSSRVPVKLPLYAWDHEEYWLEIESMASRLAPLTHPFLANRLNSAMPTWQFHCDTRVMAYLQDHSLWESVIFPAAGYAEIGLAIAREQYPDEAYVVEQLESVKAMFVAEDGSTVVQVALNEESKSFAVYSSTDGQTWELNARGRLVPQLGTATTPSAVDLASLRDRLATRVGHDAYYESLRKLGYQFGPDFSQIGRIWRKSGESLALVSVPQHLADDAERYHVHPAVLDAFFQACLGAWETDVAANGTSNFFFLPKLIRRIRLYAKQLPNRLWVHVRQVVSDGQTVISDISVHDEAGETLLEIAGFELSRVEHQRDADSLRNGLYQSQWLPQRLTGTLLKGDCQLPTNEAIVAQVQELSPTLRHEFQLDRYYNDFSPRERQAIAQVISNALIELGWDYRPGDVFTLEQVVDKLKIADEHHELTGAMFGLLSELGKLRRNGTNWQVEHTLVRQPDVIEKHALFCEDFPLHRSQFALLKAISPHLGKILRGEIEPLEYLFPNGDDQLLREFYAGASEFPVLYRAIQAAVQQVIDNLPARRAIRILELGGGTGSLTSFLLSILPEDRCDYFFTDIGPSFLASARKRFADYPFVQFQTFDIERSPQDQGIPLHSFDLIVASNVIHATADVRQALSNIKECLAHDGLLLFQEVVLDHPILLVTFGLLPGWWRSTDERNGQGGPLLDEKSWKSLLSDVGFCEPRSLMSSDGQFESEQAVLLARAPGVHDQTCDTQAGNLQLDEAETGESTEDAAEQFVIIADGDGFAADLASTLKAAGHDVLEVRQSNSHSRDAAEETLLVDHSVDEFASLFEKLSTQGDRQIRVIHCSSLDCPNADLLDADDLLSLQRFGSLSLLHLSQALQQQEWMTLPRVYVITRDAQRVVDEDRIQGLAATPVVGFLRVANNEMKGYCWSQIDLQGTRSEFDIQDVSAEILSGNEEQDIALRNGRRYVNRLGRVRLEDLPTRITEAVQPDGSVVPFRLQTARTGVLDKLTLNASTVEPPTADEIEVKVCAGGINFRDVMKALGIYPGNPIDLHWYGDDFAGVVTRVGANVKNFRPGDRVAGMAAYAFRSTLTVDHRMAFPIPTEMEFTAASTLPTVFLTAYFAICELARMQPGEKILIHAAAGGVGQAAVQVSQQLGLEVFATAGTPEKRLLLKKLGVEHVMDSRTLDFADEILRRTDGEGVDAVLNSLAGEFLQKSVDVLAPFGRFLEIGKIDVYGDSKIGLSALKDNISWHVIDLAQVITERPKKVASMFGKLAHQFAQRELKPLTYNEFAITDVVEAFRFMAQGKHIGKNVLSFESPSIPIRPNTTSGARFRADATYLITGGAGGFGLEVAKWMAREGARHLVLVSRSGPHGAACDEIVQLRADGVKVKDIRCDVTNYDELQKTIAQVEVDGPPLDGVIHAAMILADDFIRELDDASFCQPLRPKVQGGWNLHRATRNLNLSHFICFSSVSTACGAMKQANYNAGNYFLESLADYRNRQGLPAMTIGWGAITGAGFVERNQSTAGYLSNIGILPLSVTECLAMLDEFVSRDVPNILCSRVNWQQMSRVFPAVSSSPRYSSILSEQTNRGSSMTLRRRLAGLSKQDQAAIVEDFLAEQVGGVLGIDEDKVDRLVPLTHLGVDSLMAVELMNRIETESGTHISMGGVLSGPTLREFAVTVLSELDDVSNKTNLAAEKTSPTAGNLPSFVRDDGESKHLPASEDQQECDKHYRRAKVLPWFTIAAKTTKLLDSHQAIQALQTLAKRHEVIRSSVFRETDSAHFLLEEIDSWSNSSWREFELGDQDDEAWQSVIDRLIPQQPASDSSPLLQLVQIRLRQKTLLLFCGHPSVVDEWSLAHLLDEFLELVGNATALPKLHRNDLRYRDYVTWQRHLNASDIGTDALREWAKELDGAPLGVRLPKVVGSATPECELGSGELRFEIDNDKSLQIHELAAECDTSPEVVICTLILTAIRQVSGQNDFLFHYLSNGRPQAELQQTVGPLAKIVPMRFRVEGNAAFGDLLAESNRQWAEVSRRQHLAITDLIELFNTSTEDTDVGVQVILDVGPNPSVSSQFAQMIQIENGGLNRPISLFKTTPAKLAVKCRSDARGWSGSWLYDSDKITPVVVQSLHKAFEGSLEKYLADPYAVSTDQDFSDLGNTASSKVAAGRLQRRTAPRGDKINWTQEVELPSTIRPSKNLERRLASKPRYFLTGATGFVGAFLLDELIRTTDAEIVCLVRGSSHSAATNRLQQNLQRYELSTRVEDSRVHVVVGDLLQPKLGLAPTEYDCLLTEIDAIFHVAANVNLMSTYQDLRRDNVTAVEEMLRFACLQRVKPLHYVSTFTVHTTEANRGVEVTETQNLPPVAELLYGYSQTKWVAEHLVREAHQRGLPCSIYRPGHVTGHSQTGISNVQDLAHSVALACLALKAVPDGEFELDLTPVDYVVGAITALALQPSAIGGAYHLTNPKPLISHDLQSWSQALGSDFALLPFSTWCNRIETMTQQAAMPVDQMYSLVKVLCPDEGSADDGFAIHPRFDTGLTRRHLAETNVRCHAADAELLDVYMRRLRKTGVVDLVAQSERNGQIEVSSTANVSRSMP